MGGGLIQQQNRPVGAQNPGQRQSLAFTQRQSGTTGAEPGVKSVRQRRNDLVELAVSERGL